MFLKTNFNSSGKKFALIPESFTTVKDYANGPLQTNPYSFGVAAYWRATEKGVPTTSFGAFSVLTYLNGSNTNLYTHADGTPIPELPSLTYNQFLNLLATTAPEVTELQGLVYTELLHKIGHRSPYTGPRSKMFDDLDSFYDEGVHHRLHHNPEQVPDNLDGWLKWSNKTTRP